MLLYQYLWNDADEWIYLETFLKSIETFFDNFTKIVQNTIASIWMKTSKW